MTYSTGGQVEGRVNADDSWSVGDPDKPIQLQFKAGPSREWTVVRRFAFDPVWTDFELTHRQEGYWRLYYPGDDGYVPSSSKVVRLYRSAVFRGMKVSRKRARIGQKVTFGGRLMHRAPKGEAFREYPWARAKVLLGYTCNSRPGKITGIVYVWTDARGRFSRKVVVRCNGTFAAAHFGSVFLAYSPFIKVKATG